MDKFKEKIASVRAELEAALTRAETTESEVKRLTDENVQKDQEITSLKTKIQFAEDQIAECETRISDAKSGLDEGESAKMAGEGLSRKVALLEAELEAAERNLEQYERKAQQLEGENSASESKVDELVIQYNTAKADLEETYKGIQDL
ncbi:hypothetical protein BGX33_010558 [Mortierella sp. NVP41]|nr:hypothetical protein BGX33_010558 [Mortierella sp. NVP41]